MIHEGGRARKILVGTVIAAIVLVFFASMRLLGAVNSMTDHQRIQLGDTFINAKVVSSNEDRRRGLSGSSELAENTGMLFVFPVDDKHGIWMKEMAYPIDIIWLSSDKQVIDIEAQVSPDTYPAVFTPDEAARYVIEVPSGFAAAANVRVGSQAGF